MFSTVPTSVALWLAPAILIVLALLAIPKRGELSSAYERRLEANRKSNVYSITSARGWRGPR